LIQSATQQATAALNLAGISAIATANDYIVTPSLTFQIQSSVSQDYSQAFAFTVALASTATIAQTGVTGNTVALSILSDVQLSQLQTIARSLSFANVAAITQDYGETFALSLSIGGNVATNQQAASLLTIALSSAMNQSYIAGQSGAVALIVQTNQSQSAAQQSNQSLANGATVTVISGTTQTQNLSFTLQVTAEFLAVAFPPIPDKDLVVYVAGDTSLAVMFAAAQILSVAVAPSQEIAVSPQRPDNLTVVIQPPDNETIN
jgi:hypothetical protein